MSRVSLLPFLFNLNVLTINANGLRMADKRASFLQWLRSLPVVVTIVCLQEVHCATLAECDSWFRSSGFLSVVSPGSVKSCGCIVLFRPSLSLVQSWADEEGRFLQCEFSYHDQSFRVVSLYAPNRNPARNEFLEQIADELDPTVPTLLCGDFNTVFDRSVDRRGSDSSDTWRESSAALKALFESSCCVDAWRYLHPDTAGFSWTRPDGTVSSRIDLIGCPYVWVASMSSCDFVPCPLSDHCALLVSVFVPGVVPPGPGLWKLNASVLGEDGYVQLITSFWNGWRFKMTSFSSLAKWWEVGKREIRQLTKDYCVRRARETRESRDLLVRLSDHLKARFDEGLVSAYEPYRSTLNRLAEFDLAAAKGAQVRSRIRWVEEGETSSSYFCRLEKTRSADRWISAIRNPSGRIVSDPHDLCDSFSAFYSDLFTASPVDSSAQQSLLSNLSAALSQDQADLCEGYLGVEECREALMGMARNKAPGSDGLPMEFYVKFWDVLGSDLVTVLNSCFDAGLLSSSQRRGVISLSFKKGDRLDPRNWRPISLLNVDYKLAARVLAGRLLKVIHLVVADDQTCGVPGRYIGENVAFLRDVVHYASFSGQPIAILSLDQEKAFDRVDWGFMRSTLLSMGFGQSFVKWVDLFYTDVSSAVSVNGYLSSFFSLSRGVRQGCPLSPLLYVLVSEVLAVNIRANPRIEGLTLPGSSSPLSPISQYADDTSLVVVSDDSIRAIFEVYAVYEKGSGAKLNQKKSKGLWLGSWSGRLDPPVPLDWSSTKIKTLGVVVGPGDLEVDNWQPRIDAVEKVLSSWRQRSLSFRGKALVINALALSRVWYVASLIHMPDWVTLKLVKLAFHFFWGGKRELVRRVVIVQPPDQGGFSVVDVQRKVSSLLAQWVRRFLSSYANWSYFLSFWFFSVFNCSVLDVFSRPFAFSPLALPPFYQSLLLSWRSVNGSFSVPRSCLVMGSPPSESAVSMSAKSCYSYLLSVSLSPPHCVAKFRPRFGDLYWPTTWKSLSLFPLDRPVTDLNWKIAHGVLYTVDRLISFGYGFDPTCFCSSPVETAPHLFYECPLAQSVLSWLQSLMFKCSPLLPSLSLRHVLFGFSPDELVSVPRIFVYLLNVCKFFSWLARNDFRFRDTRPGAIMVIGQVKARVAFYLPLYFKRFRSARRKRYFLRQWCANGTLGSVGEAGLSISL